MTPELFQAWWPAFLTTILVETPIYTLFSQQRLGLANALIVGVALQAVTHPCFWLAWDALGDFAYTHYIPAVVGFELVITLAEAGLLLWVLGRANPRTGFATGLLASTVANVSSILVGLLK